MNAKAPRRGGPHPKAAVERWHAAARRDRALLPTARLVASAVADHLDWGSLETFVGPARLAEETGLSVRTVKRALKALRGHGYLRQLSKGGSPPDGRRVTSVHRADLPEKHAAFAPSARREPSRALATREPAASAPVDTAVDTPWTPPRPVTETVSTRDTSVREPVSPVSCTRDAVGTASLRGPLETPKGSALAGSPASDGPAPPARRVIDEQQYTIVIWERAVTRDEIMGLDAILARHPGDLPVDLGALGDEGTDLPTIHRRVTPSNELRAELQARFPNAYVE
jgi:hypothetical protein